MPPLKKRVRWVVGTNFVESGTVLCAGSESGRSCGGYVRGPSRKALAERKAAIARWETAYASVLLNGLSGSPRDEEEAKQRVLPDAQQAAALAAQGVLSSPPVLLQGQGESTFLSGSDSNTITENSTGETFLSGSDSNTITENSDVTGEHRCKRARNN